MVIYELQCELGHKFEGWFKDAQSFERQAKTGLVQCAVCGSDQVHRVPAGCHYGKRQVFQKPKPQKSDTSVQNPQQQAAASGHHDPVVMVKTLQKYVKDHFKDVGGQFTDKAIQMKNGEITPEPICGTASLKDRDRLESENISYLPLPKLPESMEN